MKKFSPFISLFIAFIFCACSQKAVYNENLPLENNFSGDLLQKSAIIYVDKNLLKATTTITPLTKLGSDKVLSIKIYDFVAKGFKRFFDNIFYKVEIANNENSLKSADFIIKPKIIDFGYGFFSPDNMDVTAKTFVEYSLWITIEKSSGKSIFIKSIPHKKYFSPEIFFAPGDRNFALIAPVFQRSINDSLNSISSQIIKSF